MFEFYIYFFVYLFLNFVHLTIIEHAVRFVARQQMLELSQGQAKANYFSELRQEYRRFRTASA
jgi:hypothetical protein